MSASAWLLSHSWLKEAERPKDEFILDLVKSNIDYNQVLTDLSVKIGRIIGNLHLNEIIHGDLTTSNILIVKEDNDLKIYFIDFGLSIVSNHLEDKAVDLYVLER